MERVGLVNIEAHPSFDRRAFQEGGHMLGKRSIG
jgi:hypothetical protein